MNGGTRGIGESDIDAAAKASHLFQRSPLCCLLVAVVINNQPKFYENFNFAHHHPTKQTILFEQGCHEILKTLFIG